MKNFFKKLIDLFSKDENIIYDYKKNYIVHTGILNKNPFWNIDDLHVYVERPHTVDQQKKLKSLYNQKVKFIIIDEFTHPELFKEVDFMNGKQYAFILELQSDARG
jgi:hypothetical protein